MNLPAEFMARTRQLMGEEACTALCEALQQEAPVSIRLNPLKSSGIPAGSESIRFYISPVRGSLQCRQPGPWTQRWLRTLSGSPDF